MKTQSKNMKVDSSPKLIKFPMKRKLKSVKPNLKKIKIYEEICEEQNLFKSKWGAPGYKEKYWREDSREDASVGKITTSSIPLLTSSVYAFQPNPTNTILPKDLPKRKFRIDKSKFNHASLPEMDKIAQPPSFIILPANNQPLSVSLAGNNIDNNDVTVHPISSKSLTPRPSTTTRRSTKCG